MSKILGSHIPAQIKNLAVNGALDFWQEKVGTTSTVNTATTQNSTWSADMWRFESGGATVKNYSLVRSTDIPSLAQSGFKSIYSNLFTMITGISSYAAGDYVNPFEYRMEGFDYSKIHSKVITFGFWFKASVAGTYSFALNNASNARSYVTVFTVSGANTWEFKTITVTLDNTGTWNFDSAVGLIIYVASFEGSTFTTSTINQWQAGNFQNASTGTNWTATTGATIQIAQFSIVEGPLGLNATGFARSGDTIEDELAKCQRFFRKSYDVETVPAANSVSGAVGVAASTSAVATAFSAPFSVPMRTVPTITAYNPVTGSTSTPIRGVTGSSNTATALTQNGQGAVFIAFTSPNQDYFYTHYVADSRL